MQSIHKYRHNWRVKKEFRLELDREHSGKQLRHFVELRSDQMANAESGEDGENQSAGCSYARDLPPELADKFVSMYVNEWTVDYGEKGREAVRTLLTRGYEAGIIPHEVDVEFVG